MTKQTDEMNRLLETVGSEMRVSPGDIVLDSVAEVLRCLPAYIKKLNEEALTATNNLPH